MDDKTRIEKLKQAVQLLRPWAVLWQQEVETRSQVNPALTASAHNSKTAIEQADVLLSEIDAK